MSISNNWKINWIDYYEILGLDREATPKEIKKAYRALMKKYHPDIYDGTDANEICGMLNEAYNVLSDETEKKKYDSAWDYKKSNPNTYDDSNIFEEEYENVTYEDVKKNYTEQEAKFAEERAIHQIIKEELEKIEEVISAKTELMYQAYKGELEKEDYYNCVKDWINITNESIKALTLLAEKAYEYGLLDEREKVFETINYLEEEIDNIPIDIDKAKWNIQEAIYNENLKKQLKDAIKKSEEKEEQFEILISSLLKKDISSIDYKLYLQRLILETKTEIYNLTELAKIAKTLKNDDDFEAVNKKVATLEFLISTTPEEPYLAEYLAKRKKVMKEIEQVLDECKQNYPKVLHMISLFSSTSDPNFYRVIWDEVTEIIDEQINKLNKAKPQINELEKMAPLNIASSFSKEAKRIYEEAVESGVVASKIYEDAGVYDMSEFLSSGSFEDAVIYNMDQILILSNEAYNSWNKGKALELLTRADQIMRTIKAVDVYNSEYRHYEKSINGYISKFGELKLLAAREHDRNLDNLDYSLVKNSNPSYVIASSLIKASISTVLTGVPTLIVQSIQPDDNFLIAMLVAGSTGIMATVAIKNFIEAGQAIHQKLSLKKSNNYNQNSTSSSNSKTYTKK